VPYSKHFAIFDVIIIPSVRVYKKQKKPGPMHRPDRQILTFRKTKRGTKLQL